MDTKAKAIKKVSESVLLKIVTNDRTYPLQAGSRKEREEWLETLNETLGLSTTGEPRKRRYEWCTPNRNKFMNLFTL